MSGGYEFDPQAVKRVEKGLKDAIAELEEVGTFTMTSQQGHGFSNIALSGLDMGDARLAAEFEKFCDRWGWAVKTKIQDANELAKGLGLNAGLYHEQEEYVVGSLKELAASASADPAAGMTAAEGASDKSLEEIRREAAQMPPADFSLPDFDEMGDQWGKVGDDLSTSPLVDPVGGEWQWDGDPAAGGAESGQGGGEQRGDGGDR